MFRVKRLYTFMLQSFLPLFMMTFFICLFIVLMQFLWRYIDNLVGKGLGIDVIAELFFYAALTMIPMALPLAILLASLMTFGNLGERFELTAMKAGGISLIKTMKPLIALMVVIAIGAFFFQNNVLPIAQTKMWTLLYSMRQKSPELEIPEGVFYDQIPGFNIFVENKNQENGMLNNMMIYDMSQGFDNARIILADSGKLAFSEDQTHLFLKLWEGELFENLREASVSSASGNVPYRRESFDTKDIIIKFDANFNRMDEQGMRNQYVGKNIEELQQTIDSVNRRLDSIGDSYSVAIKAVPLVGVTTGKRSLTQADRRVNNVVEQAGETVDVPKEVNVDSVFHGESSGVAGSYIKTALDIAKRNRQEYEYKSFVVEDDQKTIRRHGIELQKKFTLSFACIIFFFIGAPLGAIIRKGGLGMPLVISVFLFIFYYIIDNTGYKMAREGHLAVWQGMWLSSAVLLPLGILFTWKAVNDSAVFNKDAYINFMNRLIGKREKRAVEPKEYTMIDYTAAEALEMAETTRNACVKFLADNPARQKYIDYWTRGYDRHELHNIVAETDKMIEYMTNSRDRKLVGMLNEIPVLPSLLLYHPTNYKWIGLTVAALVPVGVPLYVWARWLQAKLRDDIKTTIDIIDKIETMVKKEETTKELINDGENQA